MAKEATYSVIRDDKERICGLWLRRREDTEDRVAMTFLLTEHGADKTVSKRILMGFYDVKPNDVDDRGGYFVLVRDDSPLPAVARTAEQFVYQVLSGSLIVECECEVTTPEVLRVYDDIGHGFKGFGIETCEVIETRNRNFSVACAKCNGYFDGGKIATAHMIWFQHDGAPIVTIKEDRVLGELMTVAEFDQGAPVTVRGVGRVLRFYMGKCPNEACDGNRFIMRWHPSKQEGEFPSS